MRRFLIAAVTILAIYSCDNNIADLGQNLIYTDTYMEVERYDLDQTYIVRLDSFPTSTLSTLTIGRIDDPTTGKTKATPYFQLYCTTWDANLSPTTTQAQYDSLTLNFTYQAKLAGDTTTLQTFRVYRLKDYPVIDLDDPYQYNTDFIPYATDSLLGQKSFYMQQDLMTPVGDADVPGPYILLNTDAGEALGRQLFDMMKNRSPIFGISSGGGSSTGGSSTDGGGNDVYKFMRWFRGLAIVPDDNNSFLGAIGASSSELFLRCHYHIGEAKHHFDMYAMTGSESGSFYTSTNIQHDPISTWTVEEPAADGESGSTKRPLQFMDTIAFTQTTQAVIQGLSGYMLRIKLPYIADGDGYRTIVKGEIILNTDYVENSDYPQAQQLGVYVMDTQGNIDYVLSDMTGENPIYGYFGQDPNDASQYRYTIDITDYYITMVESLITPQYQSMELIIGLPGTLFYNHTDKTRIINGVNSQSFQRAIFSELPVLNIYYADYN